MILQTKGLTKRFGRITAVDSLDLEVREGEVYGLLGPNGSGKTTTLGMILGVTNKTNGSYSWFGKGEDYRLRKQVGAILEHPIFYPYLTAMQNLRITALIKEIERPDYTHALKMVGLFDRRNDPFGTYSLGMKQRLAIASSMLSDPGVLIFDEPTNGLDPQGIAEIRKIILEIRDMGKTILLASHLLDEVQKVCTHFAVLRNGKRIFAGEVDEVLNQKNRIEIGCPDLEKAKNILSGDQRVLGMEIVDGYLLTEVDPGLTTGDINRMMMDHGVVLSHLLFKRSNLEEQFLAILKESDD
jgi:ABC-2 type transport system ATP-binding protein